MEFYLMRHGPAVSPQSFHDDDAIRPLTKEGQALVTKAARFIQARVPGLRAIYTSPATRAKDTADRVAEIYPSLPVTVENFLFSSATPEALKKFLLDHEDDAPFLIVGHNPEITRFAHKLTADISLLEAEPIMPGDFLAIDTGSMGSAWFQGKVLWRFSLTEWDPEE